MRTNTKLIAMNLDIMIFYKHGYGDVNYTTISRGYPSPFLLLGVTVHMFTRCMRRTQTLHERKQKILKPTKIAISTTFNCILNYIYYY